MKALRTRRFLCGLVVQQTSLLMLSIVLLLLSPRAKTTEHLAGFFFWQLLFGKDKAAHHVPVANKRRDALTDKPARELAGGITGTEQHG